MDYQSPPEIVITRFGVVTKFRVDPVVPAVAVKVPFNAAKAPVPAIEERVKVSPGRRP